MNEMKELKLELDDETFENLLREARKSDRTPESQIRSILKSRFANPIRKLF